MTRLAALSLIATLTGVTIALSELRWFRQLPLEERLLPFVRNTSAGVRNASTGMGMSTLRTGRRGTVADRSFRDVLGPMATDFGGRLSRIFGLGEDLGVRLELAGFSLTPTQFRTRQLGLAALVAVVGGTTVLAIAPPALVVLLALIGLPLLMFLVLEQRLQRASERHRQRVFEELPVVAEQLGMFFSAGMSLTGALQRAASRSQGACARDLARVVARIAQGTGPERALNEWANAVGLSEVRRLVGILLLHQQTADLGTLISAEARSIRRETQRRLVERIERRNEQVWIPVTVATLVPGVIFLSIPFTDTLKDFGAL